jgi:hypothetical protein
MSVNFPAHTTIWFMSFDVRQLPGWVQGSLAAAKHYGDVHGQLVRFFRRMGASVTPQTAM